MQKLLHGSLHGLTPASRTCCRPSTRPTSLLMQDPDLAPLRERREWLDALDVLQGGVTSKGIVKLRTEARAPFRLTRLIFTGGFTLSAVVGVVLLAPRLFSALKGVLR